MLKLDERWSRDGRGMMKHDGCMMKYGGCMMDADGCKVDVGGWVIGGWSMAYRWHIDGIDYFFQNRVPYMSQN